MRTSRLRTPYSRGPAGDEGGLTVTPHGLTEAEDYYERQRLRRIGHWLGRALADRQRRNRKKRGEA